MKANRIPVIERLQNKIWKLQGRYEENHIKSPSKGNPYYCCKACGIHDPELSIRDGKHFRNCPMQGVDKEIDYYKKLLAEAIKNNNGT